MSTWEDLVAAKQAADEALRGAEESLLEELAAAKAAFRKSKTAANAQRHTEAAEAVRMYRSVMRQDRQGVGVVADQSSVADQDGEG